MSSLWPAYLTIGLAVVLLTSGTAKLVDRSAAAEAVDGFTVLPPWVRSLARVALAPVEVALGVLLLVTSGPWLLVTAWVAAVLMGAFLVLVGLTLLRGEHPTCHCFGAATAEPIGASTVARNAGLTAIALVVAAGARPSGGVLGAVRDLGPDSRVSLLWLLVASVVVVVLWVRQRRLEGRVAGGVDATTEPGTVDSVTGAIAQPASLATQPIPTGTLVGPDGASYQLTELATDKARLLVFVSPTCATCHQLAPLLPDWQEVLGQELDVTIVSTGSREETAAAYPALSEQTWTDPERTHGTLGVPGTPSAVLLGTNGEVGAGPAAGLQAINELIAVIVDALKVNLMTGTAQQSHGHAPPATREDQASWVPDVGEAVPDLHVVTEDGRVLGYAEALAEIAGDEPVVTVAWGTDCGYCEQVLDPVREASAEGGVVLVVSEDVATVRAQGFTGPVLQVMPPGNALGALAVPGTPAAVPVRGGHVVGLGGLGGPHTLEVLAERTNPTVHWIDQVNVG